MRSGPTRRLGLTLTTIAALALATACSSDDATNAFSDNAAAAANSTPPTALTVTTPVSKPIPSGLDIVVVMAGYPIAHKYLEGIKAGAKTLGWNVKSMNYDPTNPATTTSTIDSAIAEEPDAVVTLALLNDQIAASLPKARAAGIPIINALTPDPAQSGTYPVLLTDVETKYQAKILTDVLVEDAKEAGVTAHILQLTVPAIESVLRYTDEGVKEELTAQCPECTRELLDIDLPDVFSGKYTQQVVSYIQRHPEINYVVSDSPELGNGLAAALQQAGMTNVKRFGVAPSNVQIEELQSGQPGAWAVYPVRVGGWIIVDQIARVVVGDKTNLWDDSHLAYVLTSANVDNVDPDGPEFPENYKDMFKELWRK